MIKKFCSFCLLLIWLGLIFGFSQENGSESSGMSEKLIKGVVMIFTDIDSDNEKLGEIVNKYSNMNNQKYLGKKVKVLLVGISGKDDTKLYGYTETMKLVNVDCDKSLMGQIVEVEITEAKSFSLDGRV